MASEYLKWKYRDVEPEQRRELTAAERRRNWWHYNKWPVALGVLLLLILLDIGKSALGIGVVKPDYQAAYVGGAPLPDATVAAVEEALAAFGEDLNGDGRVRVQLNQYAIDASRNGDASYASANRVRLMADLERGDSAFFLLDNPETFQFQYQVLIGTIWPRWGDCPALAEQELGGYETTLLGETVSGDNQALLSPLSLARRAYEDKYAEAYDTFWNLLTEGAET